MVSMVVYSLLILPGSILAEAGLLVGLIMLLGSNKSSSRRSYLYRTGPYVERNTKDD